jgi:MYXO-CTERM domain-containing protein
MKTLGIVRSSLALLALLFVPRLATATVVYSADNLPGMGTCTNGNISWFLDPQYGRVIRVHVVDAVGKNSERCEFVASNGGRMPGETYFIGWRSRVDTPLAGGWNGIYQMKCHGDHVADQPLVLTMRDNRLVLENHEDIGGKETSRMVWSTDLPVNKWFSVVLRVHYSESRTEGSVELWFNGKPQILAGGTTIHHGQTWDGSENNMHWGIYRADEVMGEGDHYLWRPRVATTFAEADPDGKPEPAAPDGSVGDASPADAGAAAADASLSPDAREKLDATGATGGAGGGGGTMTGGAGSAGRGGAGGATGGSGGTEEEPEPPRSRTAQRSGCSHAGTAGGAAAVPLISLLLALRVRRRAQKTRETRQVQVGECDRRSDGS